MFRKDMIGKFDDFQLLENFKQLKAILIFNLSLVTFTNSYRSKTFGELLGLTSFLESVRQKHFLAILTIDKLLERIQISDSEVNDATDSRNF